jgi:hypothetical protein
MKPKSPADHGAEDYFHWFIVPVHTRLYRAKIFRSFVSTIAPNSSGGKPSPYDVRVDPGFNNHYEGALWCYGTSFDYSRIASRVQNTKDGNCIVINEVKYPIGKAFRKRSADFFVDFLMGLRVFLNTEEGGFYYAEELLAQSRVPVLVPAICRARSNSASGRMRRR